VDSITATPAKRLPEAPFARLNFEPVRAGNMLISVPYRAQPVTQDFIPRRAPQFLSKLGRPEIELRYAIKFSLPTLDSTKAQASADAPTCAASGHIQTIWGEDPIGTAQRCVIL
jgi:hypothetical protein